MVPTKDGRGNYLVARNGDIFHYGDGHSCGSLVSRSIKPHSSIVSMSLSFDGKGTGWSTTTARCTRSATRTSTDRSFNQSRYFCRISLRESLRRLMVRLLVDDVFGQVYAFGDAKAYGSLRVQL